MPQLPSRNAPCPCGSGKLYKHCCRRKDLAAEKAKTARPVGDGLDQMRAHIQRVLATAPPQMTAEGMHLLDELDDLQSVWTHAEEIEAAQHALELHRPEIQALLADPSTLEERARSLFAEADFQSLRFKPEEIQRAFDTTGCPRPSDDPGDVAQKVCAAMLHLADEDYRRRASLRLMAVFSKYVAAGRYADAHILQDSAVRMLEEPNESNPCLGAIFLESWAGWAEQSDQVTEGAMRLLGVDPDQLAAMGPDAVLEWATKQAADPQKAAQIEAYLDEHPELRAQLVGGRGQAEERVLDLFKRDDARILYLSPEEVEPWARQALHKLNPLARRFVQAEQRGKQVSERDKRKAQEQFLRLVRKMAAELLTADRTHRLITDMQEYARQLERAGEKQAANDLWLMTGLLATEQRPAENRVLVSLCHLSLQAAMKALLDAARSSATGADAT